MNAADYQIAVFHVPGAHPYRDHVTAGFAAAGATIYADPDRRGFMWNLDQMFATVATAALPSWTVLLNDDLEALPGWQTELTHALTYAPAPMTALIHLGSLGQQIARSGASYGVGTNLLYGGAFAIHSSVLPQTAEWWFRMRQACPDIRKAEDRLLGIFSTFIGTATAVTARSLFDHDMAYDEGARSLMGHSGFGQPRRPNLTIRQAEPRWSLITKQVNGTNPMFWKVRQRLIDAGLDKV